jgi:AcrR family transcriptional regulator
MFRMFVIAVITAMAAILESAADAIAATLPPPAADQPRLRLVASGRLCLRLREPTWNWPSPAGQAVPRLGRATAVRKKSLSERAVGACGRPTRALYNGCRTQTLTGAQGLGGPAERAHPVDAAVVDAVLTASRSLIAVATRSPAAGQHPGIRPARPPVPPTSAGAHPFPRRPGRPAHRGALGQVKSAAVITYHRAMGRWEPDAPGRLAKAAMALYAEQGFERTTVAEIAARAGLTERTFFRHFADKREVLFYGMEMLRDLLVRAVADAPASATAMDAVGAAFQAAGSVLQESPERVRMRNAIVSANAELRERELIKLAALAAAVAGALRDRGIPETAASLAAETGVAVFKVAFERWAGDPAQHDLAGIFGELVDELRDVLADRARSWPGRAAART